MSNSEERVESFLVIYFVASLVRGVFSMEEWLFGFSCLNIFRVFSDKADGGRLNDGFSST